MAEVVTNLKVKFGADTSQFKKGMTGAEKELAGFKSKMLTQFKGIGIAAAAAFSVKAIIDFGKRAAEAADVQLQAEQKLLVALKGRQGVTDSLINQAQELQKTTLFGDEDTINAMANLAAFVKNEEAIRNLIPVVQDMATAMKMDLASATTLVGKTIGSSTNALKRYGIDIKGVAGSNERAASAVQALSDKFGGQAEAAAKVGLGPWKQLQNMIGDFVEDIGKLFMPAIQKISGAIIKAFPTGMITNFRDKVIDLVNWFRELYNESLPVRVAVDYIGIAFKNAWAVIEIVFKNIFAQFSTFGKVAKAILTGNFGEIPGIIKTHFDKITASAIDFGKDVYGNFKKGFENTATNRVELIDKNKVKEQGKAAGGAFVEGFDGAADPSKLKGTYEIITAKIDALIKKQKELAAQGKDISAVTQQIGILEKYKLAIDELLKSQEAFRQVDEKIRSLTASQEKLKATGADTTWITEQIAALLSQKKGLEETIKGYNTLINGLKNYKSLSQSQIDALTNQQQALADTGISYRQLREEIDKAFDAELKLREQLIKPFTERYETKFITKKKEEPIKPIDTTQLMPMKLLSDEQVDEYKSKLEEMSGVTIDTGAQMKSAFADIASGLGESLGKMMIGTAGFNDVGKMLLSSLGDLAIRVGKIAIAAGIGVDAIKEAFKPPFPGGLAIAAGLSLVALGTAIKGALGSVASGSVSSGTSTSGSYDSRSVTSKYVPSSSKQTIQVEVIGETTIRNRDIYIAYKNAETAKRINT